MSERLKAKFAPAFSRDLKRKAGKRRRNLDELEAVIDLILDNSAESMDILRQRHNMRRLSGKWEGSNECHVANAGDWLVIWRTEGQVAFFQRAVSLTGSIPFRVTLPEAPRSLDVDAMTNEQLLEALSRGLEEADEGRRVEAAAAFTCLREELVGA